MEAIDCWLRYSLLLLLLCSVVSFVLADPVVLTSSGGTSYSVLEDVSTRFNVSINNTDLNLTGNISLVNVTLPSNFSFVSATNGTDAGTHVFTNTSTILSWSADGLVMNLSTQYFWFNATAATPGTYNLTVTTVNVTGSYASNLSVTVNDTTEPHALEFVSPTSANASNASGSSLAINVTAADNGALDTIVLRLYYENGTLLNTSMSSSSPFFLNFTGLSAGTYHVNATVNDSAGNLNNSVTRVLSIYTATSTPAEESSSGSSGGSSSTSYSFGSNDLLDGSPRIYFKGWKASFTIDDVSHTLRIEEVTKTSVRVIVASTPEEATLALGETRNFDVDADGVLDVSVTFDSLFDRGSGYLLGAHVILRLVSPEADSRAPEILEDAAQSEMSSETTAQTDSGAVSNSEPGWFNWSILVSIIVVAIIVLAVVLFFSKPSPRKRTR